VSRNQPGTNNVYIGGTHAGSFMVQNALDPNMVLFISFSLICIAFVLVVVVVMIVRRNAY